ncbi:MBL fold metallo-hydrolase [Desulfovibrio ferrophilus]|uniref:Beta-lactamase superfamily hydrolase n=1 Tax=Desulfovibrio ferrophilus TaxID=241368 RepID=A0A2Z6B2G8_9BACT|nr:MBL fold metallo-hydrolase [Desulfovibrio ferrophilus]BBD09704.1 beta-lactamase superfamily hydrolase [Desulfovibrio ferrophilus]
MDIQGFLIECWKAVELYNSGKIDSKPWEQLEVLKAEANPTVYSKANADAMRNIISALKKMFKGDRYQELYFLKRNLEIDGASPLLVSFRLGLIALVYAALGKKDQSFRARHCAEAIPAHSQEPCFSILFLAHAFADLHWIVPSYPLDFPNEYDWAKTAAKYLDPLLAQPGIISYPYKVSWMANAIMRTCAAAHYLDKVTLNADGTVPGDLNHGRDLLNDYMTYLNSTIGARQPIQNIDVIASDLGLAQQAASAAYFKTWRVANLDILKNMEDTDAQRLAFINKPSQLNAGDNTKDIPLFYVLRRWNSFTPIVPDEADRQRVYRGGGYFIWHQNKGTVVDPGFRFIRNFADAGGRVNDIDNIVVTHAHNDHTADLESIFTVLYQHNATIKNTLKEFGAYLPSLQLTYMDYAQDNPGHSDDQKFDFLCTLKPAEGATPAPGSLQDDWNNLYDLLATNDVTVLPLIELEDLDGKALDQRDIAIMAMCLPENSAPLNITDYGLIITPKKNEDVLKAAGHAKKKVQVYVNLGTMRKFNTIIDPDSQYIDYIGGVHIIEPGQTYYLANAPTSAGPQANELKMIVHKAYHNEVVTKNYATGLEFVFSKLAGTPKSRILITSDTSLCWTFKPAAVKAGGLTLADTDYSGRQNLQYTTNEVVNSYLTPPGIPFDLLLPHIGSIKDYEVSPPSFNPKDFIYKNHLGIIGVSQVIAATNPVVALVTEFGEEMTHVIELSMDMTRRGVRGVHTLKTPNAEPRLTTNIKPADIGLAFDMDERKYYQAKNDGSGAWTEDTEDGVAPADLDVTYTNHTFPVAYKARG